MQFSDRLTLFRKHRRLNQREFGKIIGVSDNTISKYEQGTIPTGKVLLKIAEAFKDLNFNWLFRGHGDMLLTNDNTPSLSEWTKEMRAWRKQIEQEITELKNK